MARLVANNWGEFQHYKDRAPAWIKLHKRLLDNYEYQCLPLASRALAPMLWLLASEEEDGSIDYNVKRIAFRLRTTPEEVEQAVKPLIDAGFFTLEGECYQVASGPLAGCLPRERERGREEEEGEVEERAGETPGAKPKRATSLPDDFEPDEIGVQLARELGLKHSELEKFRDHHRAKGSTMKDWQAAWRTWCRKATSFAGANRAGAGPPLQNRQQALEERNRQVAERWMPPEMRGQAMQGG